MLIATFSELRNHAKKYFDAVERGESVEVYRNGKPVAILAPIRPAASERWKTARPLSLEGVSLSQAILCERSEAGDANFF